MNGEDRLVHRRVRHQLWGEGSQHLEALKKPDSCKDNAFVKHITEYHKWEESEVKFNVEIVGHYSKPVERQVCEGVYVHSDQSDLVMNSKLDHHLPAVSRVTFSSSAVEGEEGGEGGEGGRRERSSYTSVISLRMLFLLDLFLTCKFCILLTLLKPPVLKLCTLNS